LLLRKTGSGSVKNQRCLESLHQEQVPLVHRRTGKSILLSSDEIEEIGRPRLSAASQSHLSSLLSESIKGFEDSLVFEEKDDGSVFEEENPEFLPDSGNDFINISDVNRGEISLQYEDPFLLNAAYVYNYAKHGRKIKIRVWNNDIIRIHDEIPSWILNKYPRKKDYKGRVKLLNCALETRVSVLMKQTHWGHKLQNLCYEDWEGKEWSILLRKRIYSFLEGLPDPKWSSDTVKEIYGNKPATRDPILRYRRFIQMLLTIDGVFMQRYTANPLEMWDWDKFDKFILSLISIFISEEFIDGDLNDSFDPNETHKSPYNELKQARGIVKDLTLKNKFHKEEISKGQKKTRFFSLFIPTLRRVMEIREVTLRMQCISILTQTRGCGNPPPIVSAMVKEKFLKTVAKEPEPLPRGRLRLIGETIQNILDSLPHEAFTGLQTKGGVRITTSACFETIRAEGGTTETIRQIVWSGRLGQMCAIRNLTNGKVVETKTLDCCTPGEYIFWRCLDIVLSLTPEELREAKLLVVSEPGKGRAITKGRAALKIVLDFVNSICSWPMHKAFPSSASGMSKEAHGWNFFKMLCSNKQTFDVDESNTTEVNKRKVLYEKYNALYVLSTDFETATDFLRHDVAEEISKRWMYKCGIPPLLIGIVCATCYKPRKVQYYAKGFLAKTGKIIDRDNHINEITLNRGVMMGDPLTKVTLHLVNIAIRELATILTTERINFFQGSRQDVNNILHRARSSIREISRKKEQARVLSKYKGYEPSRLSLAFAGD
jgi:hypothetical protein